METKTRYAKKMEDIFKAKKEFRKERAKLPFEEKIKIVVRLQQIAAEAAACANKKESRKPWKIDID
jgi:hypothetical protein